MTNSIGLTVTLDKRFIRELAFSLRAGSRSINRAVARGINRSVEAAKTQIARESRKAFFQRTKSGLSVRDLSSRGKYAYIKVTKADASKPFDEQFGNVSASNYQISAARFFSRTKLTRTRAGARITPELRIEGKTYEARDFKSGILGFRVLKNGSNVILARTSELRTPLNKVYGPSLASMLERNQRINDAALANLEKNFAKNFASALKFLNNKN